jgi:hypothetical protein
LQYWWEVNIQITNTSKVAAKDIYVEIQIDKKAELVNRLPNQKSQEGLGRHFSEDVRFLENGPLFVSTEKNLVEGRLSFMDNLIRPGRTETVERGYVIFSSQGKYEIDVRVMAENLPHPHNEVLIIEVA